MDFDPFWNFEHNLERLIGATGMDGVLLPSASVIPIEWDITPTLNAVAVKQDTTTGTKESMIEKIMRRQSKRTKKTFRDPSTISKAMLSTYFHMPIYKVAKELRVEYRILKRREMMSFISPCTLPVPSFVVDHILPFTPKALWSSGMK
nr:hypothetical protein Iba_chr02dCG6030 [Ipomoea batatas]